MSIWVDKYKPKVSQELIGQGKNIGKIKSWLRTFDSSRCRPLFIFGPPGIGKTTAAHLCCKEMGYQTIEFNASDQRNKNIIREVISMAAGNSRLSFTVRASETKDAIILDEIDGMAGNEDRGGISQLIIEIKNAKKPMIFICNDGQHQKLRSLKDKCDIIEFRRPDFDSIRAVVAKIASKEGLILDKINVRNLAESSDYDIRQIVNSLSLFKYGSSDQITKTSRMNAFEATKKVLAYSKQMTLDDRFECFFSDYNIMPLFIFENYTKFKPLKGDQLSAISRAADSLCLSDLAEKEIRSNQNWSLLNAQALLSTVIPSTYVASSNVGRIDFPQFLGKLSNKNKRLRLTQELNAHMCLTVRNGLDPDYLDVMQQRLSAPLIKTEALGGVDSVVDFMCDYSLLRDDFNSIMELATWSFKPDPMTKVETKTKHAFTNAYKKRSIALPYFSDDKFQTKKRKPIAFDADDEEEFDEEEEEEIIVKPKRVIPKKQSKPKNEPIESAETKTAKTEAKVSKAKTKVSKAKAKPEVDEVPKKKAKMAPVTLDSLWKTKL
jgi:replication factor C subunit 1